MGAEEGWNQTIKLHLGLQVGVWWEVDRGLSRTGVQSFALEGTLGELQVIFLSSISVCEKYCCDLQAWNPIYR